MRTISPTRRELAAVGLSFSVYLLAATHFDLSPLYGSMRDTLTRELLGELLLGAGVLVILLATFAWRRHDELRRDHSARQAAERAALDAAERHRLLMDRVPVMIAYVDGEERYQFVNSAYAAAFDGASEELIGRRVAEVLGPEAYQRARPHLARALAGSPTTFDSELAADGAVRQTSVSYVPHQREGGSVVGMFALHVDTTEHRQLEEQLRQAQKMEALGRLAGGVAHDFNNLLTVISASTEFALAALPDPGCDAREDLREVQLAVGRAAQLTRQLLTFSRRQVTEVRVLSPNDVVIEADRMLRRLISEDILLVVAPEACGRIRADAGQLEQVLVNLVVNARDALPTGGRVRVGTEDVVVAPPAGGGDHPNVPPGRYVVFTVTDSGCGMDETTRAHIFEPFFTTKDRGKGTGLGLATVYGIVTQASGHIVVQSEPERGSTFRVYWPAVDADIGYGRRPTPVRISTRGVETVLVVEDEAPVRRLAARALEQQGYRVLAAADGEHALALARQHEGPIDLVLSDVIMPGPHGPELVSRLRMIRPSLTALLMSGYSADEALPIDRRTGGGSCQACDGRVPIIEKPFTTIGLAARVREALSKAGGMGGAPRPIRVTRCTPAEGRAQTTLPGRRRQAESSGPSTGRPKTAAGASPT